jgi:mono/diheme cytochrome c family protein
LINFFKSDFNYASELSVGSRFAALSGPKSVIVAAVLETMSREHRGGDSMNTKLKLLAGATILGLSLTGQSLAQDKTISDGVFTQAQADAGKLVYDSSCKNCHNMRFYRDLLKSWNNQPLIYLWENILGTMPADNPGSLMLEEYTDVIAYILSENDFPAGEHVLDPDNGMDAINILAP